MSNLNYSIPHFKTPFLSCKYSQSSFSPTTYTVSSFHFSTVATYFSYIYYHNTIVIHICKFYFFPLFHLIIISPKPFQSITSVKKYFFTRPFLTQTKNGDTNCRHFSPSYLLTLRIYVLYSSSWNTTSPSEFSTSSFSASPYFSRSFDPTKI